MVTSQANQLYGLVAEFRDAEELVHAAEQAKSAGYDEIRAYTPYRIEALSKVLGHRENLLPWLVYFAIFLGIIVGFVMQYWSDVINYPINVAGRPLNSWPSFIIIMFELAILFSALVTFGGMLLRNGLPLPYHPIFNTPDFDLSSGTRFYLCIKVTDRQFHLQRTREFLQTLNPKVVSEAKA
jgi:hypothetical protein